MKKDYIDFVCTLHGYLIRVKEIHWNTNSDAEHLKADEFESELHDCEDEFMECCMGMDGQHFPMGKLLPMLPNATEFMPMLKELENDILKMMSKCKSDKDGGLDDILKDMLKCVNKYKYRITQK